MSRILLVEDNKLSQKMMFYTLKRVGLSTDMADDGKMAIDMAKSLQYDLILMDIMMPEYDGYEATRIIRRHEAEDGFKRAFIVGLTSNVYDGERAKCIEAGMDEYLPKPFDVDRFMDMMRQYNVISV